MATNFGTGVSNNPEFDGYNYDTVVFQKGKPPLDSELNLLQELQNAIGQKDLRTLPSGWLTAYTPYADRSLALSSSSTFANKFYTQNPSGAKPEFALVNGHVIYITGTGTSVANSNIIDLSTPPTTGNRVNGVILEAWRALIDPSLPANKPEAATIIDTLSDIFMFDSNNGWICGTNGLVLSTTNGGITWPVIPIDTKRNLNGIHFYNGTIGWVVGENGTIARSSSSGQTWTVLTSNTAVNLNSVHGASQTVVWTVGDNGVILKASNGVTFTPVSSPTTNNLNKVHFVDVNHGWIVGDNGTILLTSNGGVNWTSSASGTTENLNSVIFYNVNFGFAVGNNGTILRSSDGGITWINQSGNISGGAITNDLYDVNLYPKLDVEVPVEEVSSQLGVAGTVFTLENLNITGVDRKGVVTYTPTDVAVTVNGNPVTVVSVNGYTGVVQLAVAPGPGAVTMVHYFYKYNCALFEGKAWIVGSTGKVLNTSDIGSTWTAQTSGVAYDIEAVSFISQTTGWFCGAESIIRTTSDGGITWVVQQSDVFSREIQRIYPEGNLGAITGFLEENSIDPNANIETTLRVQVQYRIRVIEAVDPLSNPEAGLSSSVLGVGPSISTLGTFPYENMGSINGDYGCWRAKHNDTLDGYVYAIPMFFVARRNTTPFNAVTQPNGQHVNVTNIRPDLLLATNVVMSDIGDVRRRSIVPSTEEIFQTTFDALSANTLRTNFTRSVSGDQYGVEILQVDPISNTADVASGSYNSGSTINNVPTPITDLYPVPGPTTLLKSGTGLFHPFPSHYRAQYSSPTSLSDKKLIPGQFFGHGTSDASFVFNSNALDSSSDPGLFAYNLYADFITEADSSVGLTFAPVNPGLVIDSGEAIIYQGVLDSTAGKVIESWDSNVSGYPHYAMAYSIQDPTSTSQQDLASPVEVHYFKTSPTTSSTLTIPFSIVVDPDASSISYNVRTIRQVNNITAGFPHWISNVDLSDTSSNIVITAAAGYQFQQNSVFEVVAGAISNVNNNIRNGASINFNTRMRGLSDPCISEYIDTGVVVNDSSAYFNAPAGTLIYGWSTTNVGGVLNQTVCWSSDSSRMLVATPTLTQDYKRLILNGSSTVFSGLSTIQTQLFLKKTTLAGPLSAGYKYVPYQTQELPVSLTVEPVSVPTSMYVSTAGAGGGNQGVFDIPIEHIPVNNSDITSDKKFSNLIEMQLANYLVNSGFVQLPVLIPGTFLGSSISLTSIQTDSEERSYYSNCSRDINFYSEGLQSPVARKMYVPTLMRVTEDTSLFKKGEYVLVVFSKTSLTEKENTVNSDCISIYRVPGRQMSRL